MKRIFSASMLIVLSLLCLVLCGCDSVGGAKYTTDYTTDYTDKYTDEYIDESINKTVETALGDTGFSVQLPADAGFAQQESEKHEFFGTGIMDGSFAIMANRDEKGDYNMETYAKELAEVNGAEGAKIAADGNYYFTRSDGEYTFYTAMRQTEESFCRITFYCFTKDWTKFESRFVEWATTIRYNK